MDSVCFEPFFVEPRGQFVRRMLFVDEHHSLAGR